MATTVADREVHLSFPISKTDKTADGDLLVYGKVTDGTIDSDDQIVDPEWSAKALQDWFSTGPNLRVQHQAQRDPAGVGLDIEIDRDGDHAHWLKALVVEPVAKRLVEKGALRAFSVGIMRPKILTHGKARGGLIAGGDLGEVSLVDRPANRNCAFSLVKAAKDGSAEWVGKMEGDDAMIAKALQPTPADVARVKNGNGSVIMTGGDVRPHPEKGTVPDRILSGMYSDPVANRLNDALAQDAINKIADDEEEALVKAGEADLGKKHREFSASERRLHAKEGNALPDGSYPIPDKDALRRAAILARSGHGNVAGARQLIARRAREMGVKNPLDKDDKVKKSEELELEPEPGLGLEAVAEKAAGDGDKCSTCKGAGKIRGGSMNCPDCSSKAAKPQPQPSDDGDDDDGGDEADTSGAGVKEAGNKAAGSAPSHSEPSTGGSGRKPNSAAAKPNVTDPDASDDEGAGGGGQSSKMARKSKKSQFECGACGCMTSKSAAFCSGCGAAFTGKRADPAAGVAGKKPTEPLPRHREPDGGPVEDLEHDAGLHTDTDPAGPNRNQELGQMGWPEHGGKRPSSGSALMDGSGTMAVGGGNSTSVKMVQAPYYLARAHDAFCAAWPASAVLDEYPSLRSVTDAVNAEELYSSATKAVSAGEYDLGECLLAAARGAGLLSKADAGVTDDARAELHKAFTEMYPDVHLTPGMITAQQFQRPYISAGHSPLSAQPPMAEPSVSMPPEAPRASQFTRGSITAGHERPSPGNKSDPARMTPGDGFYTSNLKAGVRSAMQAVHDDITRVYPDLCPMGHAGTPLPQVTGKGETMAAKSDDAEPEAPRRTAEMIKAMKKPPKGKKNKKGNRMGDDAGNLGPSFTASTKAIEDSNAEVKAAVMELTKAFGGKVEELQQQINLLGSQPDPYQAPNRGILLNGAAASGGALPAERRSLVDEAVKAQQEKMQFLESLAMSGDPTMREQAQAQISKMLKA